MSVTTSTTTAIHIVALGVDRHVAATMIPFFNGTPYCTAAILDLKSEPAAFRYSPHNLGVVLYNLHPHPRVFITGKAVDVEMTRESTAVWNKYVEETGAKDTLVINLCDEQSAGGDWMSHIKQKLEDKYGNKA